MTTVAQSLEARHTPPPQPGGEAPRETQGKNLTVRGLCKSFDAVAVLRGVDLHIPAGQFVAIIGRSGCGKSTLLRLVAGLDAPTAGSLRLSGTDPADPLAADVRVMYQEPRLLPWARVIDNVKVGAGRDIGTPATARAAEEALSAVGLETRGGAWPSVLSGGQRQRVALARALVSRPKVLALDEPLGALDALTRIEMQSLLEEVWQRERFTALLVTHDVAEAIALADRIVLIEEGQIALDLEVTLPRPRKRGSPDFSALEGTVLDRLLHQ